MNILLVYSSKYGYTRKCVNLLVKNLNANVDVYDIKYNNSYDLSLYDIIIIGGPIFFGRVQNKLRKFCLKNVDILKTKKIGLFITCIRENQDALKEVFNSFPEALFKSAVAIAYFGGEIRYKKLCLIDRLLINMIFKYKNSNLPQLDIDKNIIQFKKDNIERFCENILN